MKWYQGNIAEAVTQSKTKNAIFVVFVEGKDENSEKLSGFINDQRISDKLQSDDFVAIKIEAGGPEYIQFATIYKMVPIPSIFFIGKSGAPLLVATAMVGSVNELEEQIGKALLAEGKTPGVSTAAATSSFIAAEQQHQQQQQQQKQSPSNAAASKSPEVTVAANEEIVCEGDVCYKRQKGGNELAEAASTPIAPAVAAAVSEEAATTTKKAAEAASTAPAAAGVDPEAGLAEMRKQLEQKRRERAEQDRLDEKERELQRRRDGKELQNHQQWQKQQELKDLKENLKRDRLAEQAARERIKAQIAADRAEWTRRNEKEAAAVAAAAAAQQEAAAQELAQQPANTEETTRLQFRLSNGTTKAHSFNCQQALSVVRAYVKNDLLPGTGIKDFVMTTTYPKRELSIDQDAQNLVELGLFPSAVILVIGKEGVSPTKIIQRNGGLINMLTTIIWTVLSPVFTVFGYLRNMVGRGGAGGDDANGGGGGGGSAAAVGAQKRASEEEGAQHDAAKRRNLDRLVSGATGSPTTSSAASAPSGTSPAAGRDDSSEQSKAYRRYTAGSNIHRLTDNSGKDSDDDNATWNGNSTQQQ